MHLLSRIIKQISHEGFLSLCLKVIYWPKFRTFRRQIGEKEWEKAARIGEYLVKRLSNNIELYMGLAHCYKGLENHYLATNTMQKGLEKILLLTELVEKVICKTGLSYKSYEYMGGDQNLGCIAYEYSGNGKVEEYITKIVFSDATSSERLFYLTFLKNFPGLQEITPRVKDYSECSKGGLVLITVEKIVGQQPVISKKVILDIINANKIISGIKYKDIKHKISIQNYKDEFTLFNSNYPLHPISALHSFIFIHNKSTNIKLFQLVFKHMNKKGYSSTSYMYIGRLKEVIFQWEMFNRIDIDRHYSLQHGDFFLYNMLHNQENNNLYLIDWGNLRIGPSWVDLAGFFGQLKVPFQIIHEEYLLKPSVSGNFDKIEKIFFIYTLIITWFIIFPRQEFEDNINLFLLPAIEAMEKMMMDE